MNTKRVNTAADVILRALTQNRTAAGIATALESAQLLMSPETAVELERLRGRVAELEAELYTEQAQHRATLEQRNAHAEELLALRGGRAAPYSPAPEAHAQMREGLTRYFAGQEPALEGEHYAAVHHEYRVGRDLPKSGGAR